jgi:ferritin-like metal-binding protein YciE
MKMVNVKESPAKGKINSAEEAFIADLGRGYDSEQLYLEALQQCEQQAQNQQLKSLLQMHIEQTQEQIRNIEQIFQIMGQQPQRIDCASARALVEEGKQLVQQMDNPVLRDAAIAAGQARVEAIEIASYDALITAATQKGQKEVVNLLMKNVLEERKAAAGYGLCLLELSKQAVSS